MTDIGIDTGWNGLVGHASCIAAGRSYTEEGATQAEALSRLCAALAKNSELIGQRWFAPNCGMRGVVGDLIKKGRRRQSISEMSTFELHGGKMHSQP